MALGEGNDVALASETKRSNCYQPPLQQCCSSPTGAHHWLIDDKGMGQCKYCREKRQFAQSVVPDNAWAADVERGASRLMEKWLRAILHNLDREGE